MAGSLYTNHLPDFLTEIELLPLSQVRRIKPVRNGLRLALSYSDYVLGEEFVISDVWPDFLDESGASMPKTSDLEGRYKVEMHIVFPEMRRVHFETLSDHPEFLCTEGTDIVGRGRYIKWLGNL